ncbi:MAG: FtsW/RodA/SpoVE family cell cycle protein [Candidatus Nomurabacteria bacterium]|jgi:cell division protein FtsW|nr:FtsW/RodA/SpoVE family cell cycle protein [Candidatus Nomurabacteria bacterium]
MNKWVPSGQNQNSSPRRAKLNVAEIRASLFDTTGVLKLGRKHRPDYLLVVLIMALAMTGLVVLFSITPALTGGDDAAALRFMLRQGLFLTAGLVAFFIASRIPLDFWRRHGVKLFALAFVTCFVLPIMGWLGIPPARCALGACRWYSLGSIGTFQPAEFLKFGTVLFVSGFLAVQAAQNRLNSAKKSLLPLGIMMIAALFVIVIMQKDLGTGVALVAIVLTQLLIAGVRLRILLLSVVSLGAAGVLSILVAPHRLARVATFLGQGNEVADYHINQAMIALGSGGMTGRGLGRSVQAFGWLPEAIHDSVFAILGETLGFIGLFAIILIFAVLLKQIINKVDFIENMYLKLIVAGVFGWLTAHVIMNIGAMTHLLPLTGITLPLVSLGGTSMLFIMMSLGVVFAISRYTTHRKVKTEKGDEHANFVRGRRIGRPYHTDRSNS